ncbi:hypothetical protein SASPL_127173 [Salvia splendens]|uniref:Uncharacterized protein n=1 Tax=Salvia splendens TaxID=180675 RepID=A0A8X8XN57_SALSN|nr:hypothetical protein SASPL_127173 [Salvia splendens]
MQQLQNDRELRKQNPMELKHSYAASISKSSYRYYSVRAVVLMVLLTVSLLLLPLVLPPPPLTLLIIPVAIMTVFVFSCSIRESDDSTSLYPCTFRDSTSSTSDDYTSFVKSYARLLDKALDAHAFIYTNGDDADKLTSTIEVMPQHVIHDSICWYAVEMDKVLENLIRMPYRSCVEGAVQAEELSRFHDWFKGMGYCGSYEYPYIDRIPASRSVVKRRRR